MRGKRHAVKAIGFALLALAASPSALANDQGFTTSQTYMCVTETALFAAPAIAQHGEWSDPPARFQVQILPCETFCLPPRSRERPLSLWVTEPDSQWPAKFDGYRGQAAYHSTKGGSVILSATGLGLTRTMIGSMPGAENQVSLTLNAACYPVQ